MRVGAGRTREIEGAMDLCARDCASVSALFSTDVQCCARGRRESRLAIALLGRWRQVCGAAMRVNRLDTRGRFRGGTHNTFPSVARHNKRPERSSMR